MADKQTHPVDSGEATETLDSGELFTRRQALGASTAGAALLAGLGAGLFAEAASAQPTATASHYVGVDLQALLKSVDAQVKKGAYQDGTAMRPADRAAIARQSKIMHEQLAGLRGYVIWWTDGCYIIIRPD